MKNEDIRQLTTKELEEKIDEEKFSLSKMKLNHAVSPLENPLKIRHARRFIARLFTELGRRDNE